MLTATTPVPRLGFTAAIRPGEERDARALLAWVLAQDTSGATLPEVSDYLAALARRHHRRRAYRTARVHQRAANLALRPCRVERRPGGAWRAVQP